MKEQEFRRWMFARDYAPDTIRKTLNMMENFKKRGLDLDAVESIEDILEWFAEQREDGKTRKQLNYYVKYINRYLAFRGFDVKLKYYRENKHPPLRIPTDEEAIKILSLKWVKPDVDARNRAILNILFSTAIRINELVMLDIDDLATRGDVYILIIRHGKGDKSRIVPIPDDVFHLAEDYIQHHRISSHPTALFTTPRGRISNAFARKIVVEAGQLAGVRKFSAHKARHWRAVNWLKAGLDIEVIRRLLGHSTLNTTQVYLRSLSDVDVFSEVLEKDAAFKKWRKEHERNNANTKKTA